MAYHRPDAIKKIFHPKSRELTPNGMYVLRLFAERKPVILNVDDKIACSKGSTSPYFCQSLNSTKEYALWPLLLEKAYAKMHGDWETIEGGHTSFALSVLTNGMVFRNHIDDEDVQSKFKNG